jgi:hypothetical protein
MGQDVETTASQNSMLIIDAGGKTKVQLRVVKGYVSHGSDETVFANFALPKGMSGAPMIVTDRQSAHELPDGLDVGVS